jgi:hypothetical protein
MESEADKCQMQMANGFGFGESTKAPSTPTAGQSPPVSPAARTVFFPVVAFYFPLRFFFSSFLLHQRPPTQITARVCPFHYPGVSAVCVENKMSLLKPSSRGLFGASQDALMT